MIQIRGRSATRVYRFVLSILRKYLEGHVSPYIAAVWIQNDLSFPDVLTEDRYND